MAIVWKEGARTGGTRARALNSVRARALAKSLLDVVLVLWVAATLAFAALHFIPGDPVDNLLRGNFEITPEMRAAVTAEYGLDKPIWQQYLIYLGGLMRGDLGTSFQQRAPVTRILFSELGATAELATAATAIAILVAILVAVLTAGRPVLSPLAQFGELAAVAIPGFWIGLILLALLSFTFPIFPSSGSGSWISLVLPALTLAIPMAGQLAQLLREGLEDSLAQPHVSSARMRGAGELRIRWRHALRHALLPAITVTGTLLGGMLAGTTIVEQLFGRPGIGRIMLRAILSKDIPVVMGVVVLAAVIFVLIRLLVDVLYLAADPRLRSASVGESRR